MNTIPHPAGPAEVMGGDHRSDEFQKRGTLLASDDYQAWAETDQAAPEPQPLAFAAFLASRLTRKQASAIGAMVSAAADVYELAASCDAVWYELMDVHTELHEAWRIATERETGRKPGESR